MRSNDPVDVAIVGQGDLDLVLEARARDPRRGKALLFLRQGDAGDVATIVRRRELGEAAPAAADLQQPVAGLQVQAVGHAAIFRQLAVGQLLMRLGKDRRGIGHGGVEPQAIEIVAQIVMVRDVAARSGPRVGPQQVPQPMPGAHDCEAAQRLRHGGLVARRQFDQRRQIRAVPVARQVGFGEPDIAAGEKAAHGARSFDPQGRMRPRLGGGEGLGSAIGADQSELPDHQMANRARQRPHPQSRNRPPGRDSLGLTQPAGRPALAHAAPPRTERWSRGDRAPWGGRRA